VQMKKKFSERLWMALNVIFDLNRKWEEDISATTPQETKQDTGTTDSYRAITEERITHIENLLHYLASRVDLLAKNQKEATELVTQQNSLFEEMLNSTADYVAPKAPEAKPMIGQTLPNLDSQRPPPAPEPPTKKHMLN